MTGNPGPSNGSAGRSSDDRPGRDVLIRTLAAGIAHEFNNILGGILACSEDALENTTELDTKRSLRRIVDEVESARLVTEKLLEFACQGYLERRSTDLASLLEDALTLMAPRLRSSGVAVIRHLRRIDEVVCDAPRMEKVFLNLMANAVEAMPGPGGRLTVELTDNGEEATIRFIDSGRGVAPEVMGRVFDPFFTTKGVLGGGDTGAMGLGLAVCLGIVHMHGGSIELESTPGEETTVTVKLPLKGHESEVESDDD